MAADRNSTEGLAGDTGSAGRGQGHPEELSCSRGQAGEGRIGVDGKGQGPLEPQGWGEGAAELRGARTALGKGGVRQPGQGGHTPTPAHLAPEQGPRVAPGRAGCPALECARDCWYRAVPGWPVPVPVPCQHTRAVLCLSRYRAHRGYLCAVPACICWYHRCPVLNRASRTVPASHTVITVPCQLVHRYRAVSPRGLRAGMQRSILGLCRRRCPSPALVAAQGESAPGAHPCGNGNWHGGNGTGLDLGIIPFLLPSLPPHKGATAAARSPAPAASSRLPGAASDASPGREPRARAGSAEPSPW